MKAALRAAPKTVVPDADCPPTPPGFWSSSEVFRTDSTEEMLAKLAEMRQQRAALTAPRKGRAKPAAARPGTAAVPEAA